MSLPAATNLFLTVTWLSLLSFPLSGCATLKAIVGMGPLRPKVTLNTIELKSVTPTKIQLAVKLDVQNPNDFDLSLKELTYELDGKGVVFAKGEFQDLVTAAAEKTTVVTLPVEVSVNKALAVLEQLITRGETLAVELRAQCQFSTPVGFMGVNVKETHNIYGRPN